MAPAKLDRSAAAAVTADEIVDAAMTVLITDGIDKVSMRRVAAELGVSPIPVYNRIGNKEALLDAMAARVATDVAPPALPDEHWTDYARRWCHHLRERRLAVPDSRLLLRAGREPMAATAAPLIKLLRAADVERDAAVEAVRLLMWSVLGHAALEVARADTEPGPVDTERLFALHVDLLIDGLHRRLS